jgi:hypothetical protein
MQRLEAAKKKFNAMKEKLQKEKAVQDSLEAQNMQQESSFKESENMKLEVIKEMAVQKHVLF